VSGRDVLAEGWRQPLAVATRPARRPRLLAAPQTRRVGVPTPRLFQRCGRRPAEARRAGGLRATAVSSRRDVIDWSRSRFSSPDHSPRPHHPLTTGHNRRRTRWRPARPFLGGSRRSSQASIELGQRQRPEAGGARARVSRSYSVGTSRSGPAIPLGRRILHASVVDEQVIIGGARRMGRRLPRP